MNKSVALYGGSFDPPHNGHTLVVDKLSEIFDKVIVMPAFISPFKAAGACASAEQRVEMLKLALSKSEKIEICDYEISKKGVSYTIDTVKHLKSIHKGDDFFVVTGAENADKLGLWKDFDALKELVSFYAIPRPDFVATLPEHIHTASFFGSDVSSSQCKVALSFNKAQSLMSPKVIEYIKKNGLYTQYDRIVASYKTFSLSEKRIEHSYLSTLYGIFLAKLHDADVEKTIAALLIHDIAKSIANTPEAQPFVYDAKSLEGLPPPVQHSELGAQIAQNYFNIKDIDIINAIRYHTTARPDMSKLEEIVFLADKLESSRTYNGVDKIRNAAKRSLKEAMTITIGGTIEKLTTTGRAVSELTREALKYYKKMC